MKLSILMPALDEIATIGAIVTRIGQVLPQVEKQLIIVDDGSRDGTREWLISSFGALDPARGPASAPPQPVAATPTHNLEIKAILHPRNTGKGGAIRTALQFADGDVIVIQDADLEYDPADWEIMFDLIARRRVADVVFGSRFFGKPHRSLYFHHYLGNRLLSLLFNILFNQTLSDIECCYKMFSREVRQTLNLTCPDFGVEIELSAQIAAARRWRIYEVAVNYFGRTYQEGKKITWTDGLKGLWYIVKFRLGPGHVSGGKSA
jgi:glycosyltransferase involved in cell wall biosynthesis